MMQLDLENPLDFGASLVISQWALNQPSKPLAISMPLIIIIHSVVPALPQIEMLPGVRSFRPYTTYELELIRKHQRL